MQGKIRGFLGFIFLLSTVNCFFSQTVIWSETFQNGCGSDCSAIGYNGGNGAWSVTNTGANGSEANEWYVSGAECGNAAGVCGSICGNADPSLHLGSGQNFVGDQGAAYAAGGLGFFFVETDKRVESPVIDLSAYTDITLSFNYIENISGQAGADPLDEAALWYFDGGSWSPLDPMAVTPAGCSPQGMWTAFSILLPASANNNPNVRIGFRWINDDDNIGADPSFAVDDIELTIPSSSNPTAAFSTPLTTICEGTCIDFINNSAFGANPVFSWTFSGAETGASASQDPTNICYNTAGVYDVILTVTDDNGTDTQTSAGYITVVAPPDAGSDNTANLCNNTSLNLNTLLSGSEPGGTWTETSGTASGQFNAGTGVLDGTGLTAGSVFTFNYTVSPASPCPSSDVAAFTITIADCSGGLTASFVPSQTTICQGDCITFSENSFGGSATGWNWQFAGGSPGNSSSQDPGTVCFNTSGAHNVTLTATDGTNSDDTTIVITVNPLPNVIAVASPLTVVCPGSSVTLNGTGAVSYVWSNGVTNGIAFAPGTTDTYTVTGTDGNGCENTDDILITVSDCSEESIGVAQAFSPNNDGNNDMLFVKGNGIKTMTFLIYNRYGQKVFESDDQGKGWDGKLNGKEENPGVFVWVVEYIFDSGSGGVIKGNTTLIK
jgi:gliding motility-associated-like protein